MNQLSGSGVALCQDRMYVTRHVTDLPRRYSVGGLAVLLDYARVDELDSCRQLIDDSATRADNVGQDEYHSDDDYELLLQCSEIFVARSLDTGRPEAFVVIQPCLLTRRVKHVTQLKIIS